MRHGECNLSILAVDKIRRLSLGFQVLDCIFPGFELGDFIVVKGNAATFMSFLLSVRCQLQERRGGLSSSVVFIDGGNSFDPYLVAEVARSYSLNPKSALDRIYISRAFTVYQLSSLILEKLDPFLRKRRSRLLLVSSINSLFLDGDASENEAEDLFMKVCSRLSKIAAGKRLVALVTCSQERVSRRNLFFETVLLSRSNVLITLVRKGKILRFVLEDHPHVSQFMIEFYMDSHASLTAFMKA